MGTLSVEAGAESEGALGQLARRAPRISRADVFTAADALLVQGDRPTIDRVRMRIGRGSPNTINDHLDAWWAKLGGRLRDLPGQAIPQVPESIAHRLLELWHESLDVARVSLQETLGPREAALVLREQDFAERERLAHERATGLESALLLAREQLTAANARAAALEAHLAAREADLIRLRPQLEAAHTQILEMQAKADSAAALHTAERADLLARSAAAEQHWMLELDRVRHSARENAQRHKKELEGMERKLRVLETQREERVRALSAVQLDCETQRALREQLQEQLATLTARATGREGPSRAAARREGRSPPTRPKLDRRRTKRTK